MHCQGDIFQVKEELNCVQTAWGGVKYGSRQQLCMTAEMLNHRASPFSAGRGGEVQRLCSG